MENMKNILVMILGSTMLATSAAENLQMQKAKWEFRRSRRAIDTQITKETLKADSIITCSALCSSRTEEEWVSLYFVKETKTCYCNMAVDTSPENEIMAEIYYGTLTKLSKKEDDDEQVTEDADEQVKEDADEQVTEDADEQVTEDDDEQVTGLNTKLPYYSDCLKLYQAGHTEDGVYTIDPIGGAPTDTWCDMTNGGWAVIQRRKDGSEDFYRGWSDYVNGFGNRTGEYWLGLENIHRLTKNGSHLEVILEAFPGETPQSLTANYTSFVVGNSASNYTLQVAGFTGSCGDALAWQNGQPFSTYDNENDPSSLDCAARYGGAWWYNDCHHSHLNGLYYHTAECDWGKGIAWDQCWGHYRSAKTSVMKIRSL